MIRKTPLLLALAAFVAAPFPLRAEDVAPAKEAPAPAVPVAKLDVGSPAPEFKPAAWIQGEPVTSFEKEKTYLIECWATWCGPCVAQIPHVNGLQKKFADKGLVVIGTNVWDGPQDNVAKFVKAKGGKMSYRIAFDGKENGVIAKTWLAAAGVEGIPHAFVVRDGKIIWHGHPGELDEAIVADMIAGKFDPAKVAEAKKVEEAKQEKMQAVYRESRTLLDEKKYDEALKKIDELETLLPDDEKAQADMLRATVLAGKGDTAGALARLQKFGAAKADDAHAQYAIAMTLLGGPGFEKLRASALPFAKKADSLDEHPALKILVAQAEYAAGNKDASLRAIDAQLAVPATDADTKTFLTKASEAVKAGKPWPASGEGSE